MSHFEVGLITTSIINIIMLLVLVYVIVKNTSISIKKTGAYLIVVFFTIIVIIAEIGTNIFDNLDSQFRIYNIIANMIGFSVSASIPYLLSLVYYEKSYKKIKLLFIPVAINILCSISSYWTGWIFYVSIDNTYSRGPLFIIYILTYLFGFGLLMVSNHNQSVELQTDEKIFLTMLCLFIFMGTTIQVLFPFIHSTWHCTTLVLIMYYLFQRELQFRYDSVTNLLNRKMFDQKLQSLKKTEKAGIIIFDLNKFKQVNDLHGHIRGDYCLKSVGEVIRNNFKEIGESYRIGGDEFCVITQNDNEDEINQCLEYMFEDLIKKREKDSIIPTVSYGYSIYRKSEKTNIMNILQEADRNMYHYKNS